MDTHSINVDAPRETAPLISSGEAHILVENEHPQVSSIPVETQSDRSEPEYLDLDPAHSLERRRRSIERVRGLSNPPLRPPLAKSLTSLELTENDWEFPGWGSVQNITTITRLSALSQDKENWKSNEKGEGERRSPLSERRTLEQNFDSYGSLVGDSMDDPADDNDPEDDDADDEDSSEESFDFSDEDQHTHVKLGQLASTAIAGNDITSSCLYIISLTVVSAGKWAPFCILLVVVLLNLFRSIYTEVVTALPLNGGAYNALLNTTTKGNASVAACLTLLSYTATAVVSAQSSMSYGAVLWCPTLDVDSLGDISDNPCTDYTKYWGTIGLLGLFGILNLIGLSESAGVATCIFCAHITTLAILLVACFVHFCQNPGVFKQTWHDLGENNEGFFLLDFYFGFCSALLGISGFESAANFIEEQVPGVFSKCLRNMWVLTGFFNFFLCLLSFAVLPANKIVLYGNQPNDQLLADMGQEAAGGWLSMLVSLDALFVLSGAVLTSYVGVLGLVRRMALDRCLPQFLLRRNSVRDTNHFIIVGFFLVTSSLLILVQGDTTTIAGVYTIAFLGVMCFFTVSAMLLKFKRSQLPRESEAPWSFVIVAFFMVFMGMLGNIIEYPENFLYFCLYFAFAMVIVAAMLSRVTILKGFIYFLRFTPLKPYCENWLKKKVKDVRNIQVVFFAKIPDLRDMNKAVLYVRENEITSCLKIVHFLPDLSHTPAEWSENVNILDTMYPDLKIDLVLVEGNFCPAHVTSVSQTLGVPKNFMFMTCPSDAFRHNLSSFGGVRIVIQGS